MGECYQAGAEGNLAALFGVHALRQGNEYRREAGGSSVTSSVARVEEKKSFKMIVSNLGATAPHCRLR
jgi:hypothetical protein